MPDLNTTSTADISFMLLIFFLVTTSMDIDKGISRKLPPQTDEKQQQVADVKEGTVLQLFINADGKLLCEGQPLPVAQLRKRVMEHVSKTGADHVLQIQADRRASYDSYFQVQNEIVAAYAELRNRMARQLYGKPFGRCDDAQQQLVREKVPHRISETYQQQEGGQP